MIRGPFKIGLKFIVQVDFETFEFKTYQGALQYATLKRRDARFNFNVEVAN